MTTPLARSICHQYDGTETELGISKQRAGSIIHYGERRTSFGTILLYSRSRPRDLILGTDLVRLHTDVTGKPIHSLFPMSKTCFLTTRSYGSGISTRQASMNSQRGRRKKQKTRNGYRRGLHMSKHDPLPTRKTHPKRTGSTSYQRSTNHC